MASSLLHLDDLFWIDSGSTKGAIELLACSRMTFLPPVIALVLGMGVMWTFSVFAPKQSR